MAYVAPHQRLIKRVLPTPEQLRGMHAAPRHDIVNAQKSRSSTTVQVDEETPVRSGRGRATGR